MQECRENWFKTKKEIEQEYAIDQKAIEQIKEDVVFLEFKEQLDTGKKLYFHNIPNIQIVPKDNEK